MCSWRRQNGFFSKWHTIITAPSVSVAFQMLAKAFWEQKERHGYSEREIFSTFLLRLSGNEKKDMDIVKEIKKKKKRTVKKFLS